MFSHDRAQRTEVMPSGWMWKDHTDAAPEQIWTETTCFASCESAARALVAEGFELKAAEQV